MPKFYAELIGTLFLTTIAGVTSEPLAVGLLLGSMVYVAVTVSDAHFNPAVSLAAWMLKEITLSEFLRNLTAQFAGAVAGAAIVWWLSGTTYTTEPAQSTHTFDFIAVELLFSSLFVLVFLVMMYPQKRKNPVFGLVIGLAFAGCYMVSQPISGTGLNPALNTGYILLDWINSGYSYYYLPVYILAPITGGVGAVLAYRRLLPAAC